MGKAKERIYVLYDGRASIGLVRNGRASQSDALVLCFADSLGEAKEDASGYGDCACYSYEIDTIGGPTWDAGGPIWETEQWEFDYSSAVFYFFSRHI